MSWPRRRFVQGAAFEAARALFERLDVGLRLLDALAAREARGVVRGHLQVLHPEVGEQLRGFRARHSPFRWSSYPSVLRRTTRLRVPTSTSSSSLFTCAVRSSLLRVRSMLLWALMIV